VAARLTKTNPRLRPDKARWLAGHWAEPDAQGQWRIRGHAAHKITNAQLYRVEEALEVHKRISAPTLCLEASENEMDHWWKGTFKLAEFHERLKVVPRHQLAVVDDAGHMLHHDQPEAVAALIERFVA
jgi:pimeloyl-ACP methyl ester carboxylesterase